MEQKTNPSGEQAATQAPQPTAWIERVRALADEFGNELDNRNPGEEDLRDGDDDQEQEQTQEDANSPAWMAALADEVKEALDYSGVDTAPRAAVIFIAVHTNPNGYKHVVHEIRGGDAPLAEAIGALVYQRDLPAILHLAAAAALQMRHLEDKAIYNKNMHNHKNKKR